ncbi:hypothetical protein BDY19DRAFT_1003804 [Irpex rosettiformis]|uniref:Uncharacterized protein n=1 Tax=Irpex rosettiformis TaxID=378272 RepID=A0ACB8U728_9APHY|nr:hypothetical protein BDY19DRAFT_1003804 [Irpex rosettiformis]
MKPTNLGIKLTEVEDRVCTLLDGCTRWMKTEQGVDTSCRIAGGWVRDKLLGMQSNDIDVALTDMMGLAFAEKFRDYCNSLDGVLIEKIAKVEKNPDRSKHLETAKAKVLDIELDFVNLRSEEYSEDSRIPTQVAFGTPLQDALRRDITINALFYNVHSREVEDHTGKGLEDLKNGIVRTPLAPRETFMDDPLRVLRCVRFASRFGFSLVPELQAAAKDADIQFALRTKISRERVGEELDKMMKGKRRNPLLSIQIINDLSLSTSIFDIPTAITSKFSGLPGQPSLGLAAASILNILAESESSFLVPLHPTLKASFRHELSTPPRLYLASILTPYRHITYEGIKGRMHSAPEAAIRDAVKLGVQNHYLDGIPALFMSADLLQNPQIGGEKERVRMGLLLRDKHVHNPYTGSYWASSLLFSLVQELVPLWDGNTKLFDEKAVSDRIEVYNTFVARAEELNLHEAVDANPLLNGKVVVELLEAGKPGPWLSKVLADVVEWQLEYPDGTKDDCEQWLKAAHSAGKISFAVGPTRAAPAKRGRGDVREGQKKSKVEP